MGNAGFCAASWIITHFRAFRWFGGRRSGFADVLSNKNKRPEKFRQFCGEPNAAVFGCAGLRSLLDAPLEPGPGSVAGFMFGELVTLAGQPQFGNLMAVRLLPK